MLQLDFWRGVKLHIPTEILLSEAECGDVKNNMEVRFNT